MAFSEYDLQMFGWPPETGSLKCFNHLPTRCSLSGGKFETVNKIEPIFTSYIPSMRGNTNRMAYNMGAKQHGNAG